ncbi:hypothetical protein [uncultured Nitrospira sp.]|uniref:hypothetical protein n=1 Tax=uncultured Nitrospira sp. TaxID=157176 RepID=UPI0031405E8E
MPFTTGFQQTSKIPSGPGSMSPASLYAMCFLTGCLVFSGVAFAHEGKDTKEGESLSGERVISGTVEEVRGEQAKVDTGEVQPRYLPMNLREEKGLPALKKGDQVEITVNDQNLIVDVHLAGEESDHRIVHGILAQPLATGHEKAVIQSKEGQEESHPIRPLARSKVASIPVGAEAIFLIDEMDQIVDVTFENGTEVDKVKNPEKKKSPLKGNFKQVSGILKEPLKDNKVSVQQDGKKEQQYEVRTLIQDKFKNLSSGQEVVLFVDDENKVTDVSFIEKE